ncbi:MAG: hypothetical protein ACLUFV_07180 [Acutalibacteraceae bacterium]
MLHPLEPALRGARAAGAGAPLRRRAAAARAAGMDGQSRRALHRLYARGVHRRPLYTAYSIDTLQSNDRFSHDKATAELGFFPRDIARTVADTVLWLRRRRAKA